ETDEPYPMPAPQATGCTSDSSLPIALSESAVASALQQRLYCRPFSVGDAVKHSVIQTPVGQATVVAQQAFALGPQFLDGTLRAQVAHSGLQLQPHQLPFFESVLEQQVLDRGIQSLAVLGAFEPGPTQLGCRQG